MTVPLRTISFKLRILLVVPVLIVVGIWTLAVRATAVLQDDIQQLLSEQMSATVGNVAADIVDDPVKLRGVLEQRPPASRL